MVRGSGWFRCLGFSVVVVAMAACQSDPGPSATLTPTIKPPEVTIAGPSTQSPTATASPGAVLDPTATGIPTPSAIGPKDFPEGVNPLTGLSVDDPALLDRRPLAIKVANSPRSIRERQSGLSLADLVFEHIAEGGNTRFTAIYLGHDAAAVGPVRSARLIDIELTAMYKAAFAFSGSSGGTREKIIASDVALQAFSEARNQVCPPFCRVDPDNWNLLMVDTAGLEALAVSRGVSGERQDLDGLRFDATPPFGGVPAATITVRYSSETWGEWRYDAASGRYLRWEDTAPDALAPLEDTLTGRPVSAANVAVLFVPTFQTDILEDFEGFDETLGTGGHYGVQIQLWNTGPALVFRDGLAYHATWVRIGHDGTLGLVDADNRHVPLKPGNSWIELIGGRSESLSGSGAWMFNHKQP